MPARAGDGGDPPLAPDPQSTLGPRLFLWGGGGVGVCLCFEFESYLRKRKRGPFILFQCLFLALPFGVVSNPFTGFSSLPGTQILSTPLISLSSCCAALGTNRSVYIKLFLDAVFYHIGLFLCWCHTVLVSHLWSPVGRIPLRVSRTVLGLP